MPDSAAALGGWARAFVGRQSENRGPSPNSATGDVETGLPTELKRSSKKKLVNTSFLTPQGEAPAEPWRRQLGRSLALPLEPLADSFHYAARLSLDLRWLRTAWHVSKQ